MRTHTCFALALVAACSGGSSNVDSGTPVDTSCGIDCAAQTTFGLLAGTCFEYSDMGTAVSPPAPLAAEVQSVVTLENGVKVMQVRYTTGGQLRMQDSFTIDSSTLKLVRREWGTGSSSVSYETSALALQGVSWLKTTSAIGDTLTSTPTYRAIGGSGGTDAGTYTVSIAAASTSELKVPLKTYDSGLKLLFNETPDNGVDTRRIFVPEVGFTLISTSLQQGGAGTSAEYRLQNIKNSVDAGTACGF